MIMEQVYGARVVPAQEVRESTVHGLAQNAQVLQLLMIGCTLALWLL